jgi:hypothetical protein
MPRLLKASLRTLRPFRVPAAALGVLAATAGCLIQPSFSVAVTTADNVKLEVPLGPNKMDVEDDAINVKRFQFTPWKMDEGKGMAYALVLEFKKGAIPADIQVDDVSEDPILRIMGDSSPKFRAGTHGWEALSQPFHPADEHAKWVMTLDNGVKTYRFTVKLTDGSTHVLYYPIFVPATAKAFMRAQLGVTT